MTPDLTRLLAANDATWPAAATHRHGPWLIREGQGGGQRVSAATALDAVTDTDIPQAETAMRDLDQTPLFMIRNGDQRLDGLLEARGYRIKDPVNLYIAPIAQLATEAPPRLTTFCVWPPLAIQRDIWASGGIGAERIAVMERSNGARSTIFGRQNDHPAATAYVALDGDIAMLHALEILPSQRRQGLGRYIMRQAAFWAAAQGAQHFATICTRANEAANALYHSLGMSLAGHYHYRRKD